MKYIISLRLTHKDDAFITLWGPNNRGYQWNKSKCGLYDITGKQKFEHNIVIDEKKLDPLFVKSELYGNDVLILPNIPKVRKALGILKQKFTKKYRSDCPHINAFLANHLNNKL